MNPVKIENIAKSFGRTQAVIDVSFDVKQGEVFGLLGPNGAGKTTTIRIMLDIFKPDLGKVSILGGPMTEEKKNRIGYMPEERGLYQDTSLESVLIYMGRLKGINTKQARHQLAPLLERFDLTEHKNKKVKDLSKGMQQKAQIINTILHQPELIIIDEPFTALDPVNTQLVKELISELRQGGSTIIMSTHQMHHAEELCNRILLIDHGRDVLFGELDEIRRQYTNNELLVRALGEIPPVPGVISIHQHNNAIKLTLKPGFNPHQILQSLIAIEVRIEKFEIATPTLEEIFIRVVNSHQGNRGQF